MLAQLFERSEGDACPRETKFGFLLDYKDPSNLISFAQPPYVRLHRNLVNLYCGNLNFKVCFFYIEEEVPYLICGFLKNDVTNGLLKLGTGDGKDYYVNTNTFKNSNAYILERYSRCCAPVQIPMLSTQKEENVDWKYSKLVSEATEDGKIVDFLREWFGYLVMVHAKTTQEVVRITRLRTTLTEGEIAQILDEENEKTNSLDLKDKRSGFFWLYYCTPKPPSLKKWVEGLRNLSKISEQMGNRIEANCARHEGFYRVFVGRKEGRFYIEFDDGVEEMFPVSWKYSLCAEEKDKTLLHYYQPVCTDILRIFGTDDTEEYWGWGFIGENQDVPVHLLPGHLTASDVLQYGPIRSEIHEKWSYDWYEKNKKGIGKSIPLKRKLEDIQ